MKISFTLFFLLAAGALAQTPTSPDPVPPPDVPADTVIATINGKKFTAGQVNNIVSGLPPQLQQNFHKDKKEFLRQYALLDHLAALAAQEKLDQKTPHKERLDYVRMQVLVQAKIDDTSERIPVSAEEQKKYYDEHKADYTQAKIKILYLPFSPDAAGKPGADGKKPMSEAEAKAKADGLVKEIRAGADFVKLVKEHSQDPASAEKDGDFGTVSRSDSLPESIKDAIFSLKAGGVSDPVRQPNGFYLFRVDETSTKAYAEVQEDIHRELKEKRFQEWFEKTRAGLDVKFESEGYFTGGTPDPAPAKPAAK